MSGRLRQSQSQLIHRIADDVSREVDPADLASDTELATKGPETDPEQGPRRTFWQRWRHVRTRRRKLIGLGVPRRQAIRHAKSRKGPWQMANSISTDVGMTNDWLALRAYQLKEPVGEPCSASLNPRMRTRMYGRVGRVAGNGHPYPILRLAHIKAPAGE